PGYVRGYPQGPMGPPASVQRDYEGRPVYQYREQYSAPPPPRGPWRSNGGFLLSCSRSSDTGIGMRRLKLSISFPAYDHFRDFRLGIIQAEGIETTWSLLGHHEVFARFTFNREWDAAELSFAKFCAQVTRKNSDIIGLPVVCSRLFRFSSFYVNKKSKIKTAKDLKGKKVGSPEWAHTAAVYMRGWLNDEHGVALKDIHWYQAGTNEPGRIEKVELSLPKGVKLTRVADKSLSDMLAEG